MSCVHATCRPTGAKTEPRVTPLACSELVAAMPVAPTKVVMREVVSRLAAGGFPGDVGGMANPECLVELQAALDDWRADRGPAAKRARR